MATLYDEDELNKLVLQCPDETEYNNPSTMVDSNGKNIYAYVTLVMLGDLYIAGAIVLAQSLRNLGSKADFVVLVTPDVSEEGKRLLRIFYNVVKEINYINVQNWRTKKQHHRQYLSLVFTKFHLFNLTQYKKVILIDADALVLKYPDHLFTLNAPAGCFLEDKDLFISYDKNKNYVLPPNGKIAWYDKYCECCGHGKKLPKEMTDRVKNNFKNSGIGGGLILLEPKVGEFDDIIRNISSGYMKHLVENKFVWPEQQYLTLRYSGKWTSINPRFFGLQGYPHWKVLYGLQYGGDKPFVLESKIDMSERILYPDFILWHEMYIEIIKEHPDLKTSVSLQQANQMNKFFESRSIGRNIQITNNKEIIKYKYDTTKINSSNLKYYYGERDTTYSPKYIKEMFVDIDDYDYSKPIEKLAEYYNGKSYYTNILKSYSIPTTKTQLSDFDVISVFDRDLIMLEYIKCKKSVFILTLWPISYDSLSEFTTYLQNMGNIYYTKTVTLNKNGVRNLMFWMYNEFNFKSRLDFIDKKLEYSKVDEINNNITFIFFDNVNKLQLSGQGSKQKKIFRNKILEILKFDSDSIRGNDVLHVNDFFSQTIEYSQMILNSNSLKLLENQNIDNYISGYFSPSQMSIQTYRKWMYDELSLLEMDRLVNMGGLILYAYGIRKSNDIDGVFVSIGNDSAESERMIEDVLYTFFHDKKTKFDFADIGKEGSKYWRESWTEKNKYLLNLFHLDTMVEVATNPTYHMYHNGLKLLTIDFEIMRKLIRSEVNDIGDFLMMCLTKSDLIGKYMYLDSKINIEYNKEFHHITKVKKFTFTPENLRYIAGQIHKNYLKRDIRLIRDIPGYDEKTVDSKYVKIKTLNPASIM
jgi:hypothetical protein